MPNTFFPTIPTKLTRGVPMPTYAHDGDAGIDLIATEDATLYPGESCKMGSGVSMAIPKGFAGFVLPRSGLGTKGLVIKNGTGLIDSTYRGEIGLKLFNNNPTLICPEKNSKLKYVLRSFYGWLVRPSRYTLNSMLSKKEIGTIHIHKGDRIAQLVIVPVACAQLVGVDELDETARGAGSFGSTGI